MVLSGDELLPGGVVLGVEKTLDSVSDSVEPFTRPFGVFYGVVEFIDVGNTLDPDISIVVPVNSMAAGSLAQVELSIISIIKCKTVENTYWNPLSPIDAIVAVGLVTHGLATRHPEAIHGVGYFRVLVDTLGFGIPLRCDVNKFRGQ